MATYRRCKERIDIAEKALTDVATGAAPRAAKESAGERVLHLARAPRAVTATAAKSGFDNMEDDFVF